MNCLASMVKYILYLFNLIFVICGILLIILGSLMISNIGDFSNFADAANTDIIPILIIVLGCIIFVISFFGCCGAIRESSCCMMIYAIFMFILFACQLALVIWVFVQRQEFLNTMSNMVQTAFDKNNDADGYPMDALQIGFECCGVKSYQDYAGQTVPVSCCGTIRDTSSVNIPNTCAANIYESRPGCQAKFVDFWKTNTNIIRYAGIGVCLVELVALIFACCLASKMRNSH